jgi:hypothetical protein
MAAVSPALRRLIGVLSLAACQSPERGPTPADETKAQQRHVDSVVSAGGVVDSILPIAEQLRRFQHGLQPVDTFHHASASREALVARLAVALSAKDTADIRRMVIDRAEFAFLFYPSSAMSIPPYEAPPQLLWGQILASSEKGIRRLIDRLGGASITVRDLTCPAPEHEGANQLHQRCTVQLTAAGRPPLRGTLFGTIVERDGRFKFLGYANRI